MRLLLLCLVGLLCIACSPSKVMLTEDGKKVVLLPNPEEMPSCFFVKEIHEVALVGDHSSYQQVMNQAKNATALAGATHLKIHESQTTDLSSELYGEAYRCGPSKSSQPSI